MKQAILDKLAEVEAMLEKATCDGEADVPEVGAAVHAQIQVHPELQSVIQALSAVQHALILVRASLSGVTVSVIMPARSGC